MNFDTRNRKKDDKLFDSETARLIGTKKEIIHYKTQERRKIVH
jgi:hypothetical protein